MYTSHKFEKDLGGVIATQTPAVKARHFPGAQKQVVRAIAFVVTTAMTVTDAVIALKKRPTPGSASGESTIYSATIPVTGSAIGKVYVKRGLNTELVPGDELALELITASTAGAVVAMVELDITPEMLANLGAEVVALA